MSPILDLFGLESPLWLLVLGVSIFLLSIALAVVFHKLLFPIIRRFTNWTPTNLDTRLVEAARMPLTLSIVLLGGYLALRLPLQLDQAQRSIIDTAFSLAAVVLGVVTLASAVSNALVWYIEHIAPRTSSNIDERLLPLLRRFAVAAIYVLGGLIILDQLGISISPLIAGLGLGGLAVALALQPTLANLFAGSYVMTEGVVTPGDYIELENGITGYVVDVGWRSTRLRTWRNNLVVVPNSKFAETIITNYQEPEPAVNVYLTCGVSYDSDLFRVERVCHEVMSELLEEDSRALKEYGGWFGFDSFGESNVNFWLFLQARDRLASFEVQSILMQNLHHRLRQEGIVINYPVRSLRLPSGQGPEILPGQDGTARANLGTRPAGRGSRRRSRRPQEGVQIFPNAEGGGDGGEGEGGPGGESPGFG